MVKSRQSMSNPSEFPAGTWPEVPVPAQVVTYNSLSNACGAGKMWVKARNTTIDRLEFAWPVKPTVDRRHLDLVSWEAINPCASRHPLVLTPWHFAATGQALSLWRQMRSEARDGARARATA